MTEKEEIAKLAEIIKANPGAVAYIDNDCWRLDKPLPVDHDKWSEESWTEWYKICELACSDDFKFLGITHGYGLLEAMADIHNINLEGV